MGLKLKTATEVGERLLLIANHLDQSNYLSNQKQGAANKYVLSLFRRLFQGSESTARFQGPISRPVDSLDWTSMDLIQDFQCRVTY